MPFPQVPSHIIDPRPSSNPHASWANFSPYGWFKIRGFQEALVELQRQASQPVTCDTIKQYRAAAIRAVPNPLKQLFVVNSQWNEMATTQVDKANSSEGMRFDKACIAVAALDECAESLIPGCNVLDKVTICPATFLIEGFDLKLWEHIHHLGLVDALKQHTLQIHDNFFKELAKGYSATKLTLDLTLEFLEKHGEGNGLSIIELDKRYDDRGLPKVSARVTASTRAF